MSSEIMNIQSLPGMGCSNCGAAGRISRVSRREMATVRARSYEVVKTIRQCGSCGGEFENSQDEDWRPALYACYRADTGMITPEAMVSFRTKHGLGREDVTALLGWSETTLQRYERGSLQSQEHDSALSALMMPGGLDRARGAHSG